MDLISFLIGTFFGSSCVLAIFIIKRYLELKKEFINLIKENYKMLTGDEFPEIYKIKSFK